MLASWRKGVAELCAQRFFVATFVISLSCSAAAIGIVLFKLFPEVMTAQVVPLHYNIHFGIDRTGSWWQLFVPVAMALAVTFGNFAAAATMWRRERLIAYALVLTALVVNAVMLLGSIFVVLLNLIYA